MTSEQMTLPLSTSSSEAPRAKTSPLLDAVRASTAPDRPSLSSSSAWQIHLQAPWLVWENVPGALSLDQGTVWSLLLEGLTGTRFEPPATGWKAGGFAIGSQRWCAWRVLDASHFGVAQRRRRVFAVAGPRSEARPEVLFDAASLQGDPPASRETREVAPCLTAPSTGGCRLDGSDVLASALCRAEDGSDEQRIVAPCLTSHPDGGRYDRSTVVADSLMAKDAGGCAHGIVAVDEGSITSPDNRANPAAGSPAPTLCASSHVLAFNCQQGPISGPTSGALYSRYDSAVLDRMPRRLTPIERERLMGLPDGWTAGHSMTKRVQMTGNGLAVPVAHWIANRLADAMASHNDGPRLGAEGER